MPRSVTVIDRLRIERVVWMLDQRLYDLPRRSRIAKRREVRQNLLAAAHDVGTASALRSLGSSARLADEYLTAEFGDQPRGSLVTAVVFLMGGLLVMTSVLTDAANGFGDGIVAGNPAATGTYTWPGIQFLQSEVTYTFVQGAGSRTGGGWTPVAWVLWIAATVLVGRLWRLPAMWRRQRAALHR